ncbi:TatD family hydrolase [Candidatus Gracilibacteria bacterium]|nr:TatD family hydrolase [Candidatus Gracilibacteria bacterium]MCF7819325.1 TatD family hydrolase [Candidatus Gracilibacteria bacterium]
MKIADTHTHLYFTSFDRDREKVVQRNKKSGVELEIQIGVDEVSSIAALELAKNYNHIYCTLGVHPCDVETCFSPNPDYIPRDFKKYKRKAHNFDELFQLFEHLTEQYPEKIVGFGETGFDLYHQNTPELLELQKNIFRRHIALAKKFGKPVVIHNRNSREQMIQFLEIEFDYKSSDSKVKGIIHCFSEDTEYAELMTQKYGFFLGIGGVATYPQSEKIREAIKATPIEFLLTETDAPFLTPQKAKQQHKRNESSFLPEVIQLIAELKKIPKKECSEILFSNAKKVFGIK